MGLPRNRKMLPVCASREWFIQPTYLIKWSAYHRQGVQLNIWNLRIMWAKRRDITDVRRRVANHVIFRCFLNNAKYFLYNKSLKEGKYVGTKEIPLENKRGGGKKPTWSHLQNGMQMALQIYIFQESYVINILFLETVPSKKLTAQ